jgi:alpha-tubulin suppressor-like RCC1 family protein
VLAAGLALLAACASCEESRRPTPPHDEEEPAVATEAPTQREEAEPERDPLPARRSMLALGGVHSCYLEARGAVRCWGGNQFGQIGDATLARDAATTRVAPTVVAGLADVVAIDAGAFHTCALSADASVRCWGHDAWGQSGGATREDRPTPTEIGGLDHPVALALGRQHTCVRQGDRRVVCFGDNGFGQLGDGTTEARSAPRAVVDLEDVTQIDAGRDHTCALRGDGRVFCWGAGMDGQLGAEVEGGFAPRPREIPDVGEGVTAIATGGTHTCALLEGGRVRCFGANDSGQLGVGEVGGQDAFRPPSDVQGIEGATELALGSRFSCARLGDGRVACWGANPFGQLGDGTTDQRSSPVFVVDVADVTHVACGALHTCAVQASGTVSCWGANRAAQLGAEPLDKRELPGALAMPD